MTFEEAQQRVEDRLNRIERRTDMRDAVPLLCVGTDVRGPLLAEHLRETTEDIIDLCGDPENKVPMVLNGMLVRTFWLGYEFGRTEET